MSLWFRYILLHRIRIMSLINLLDIIGLNEGWECKPISCQQRVKIEISRLKFSEESGQSLSVLTFVPVIDDDGKYLTCRAENPYITDSALEDRWLLNVQCKCCWNISQNALTNVRSFSFQMSYLLIQWFKLRKKLILKLYC